MMTCQAYQGVSCTIVVYMDDFCL